MTINRFRPASPGRAALGVELIANRVLLPSGVDGVYGFGAPFEAVRRQLDVLLSHAAAERGAEALRFPPVFPRRTLVTTGALSSIPHVVGCICAFEGDEGQALMQSHRAETETDWSEFQRVTDVAMVPAACFPVYPALRARGKLPASGAFVEAGGAWVFRHEPSDDPFRLQTFRQHELVRVGSSTTVASWREEWAQYGLALFQRLGLAPRLVEASDEFFGRGGRLLARMQRAERLKVEIVVDVAGEAVALASLNLHRDHFSHVFGIQLDGVPDVHTACVGFGHERIVLAMFAEHGPDPAAWPPHARAALGGP